MFYSKAISVPWFPLSCHSWEGDGGNLSHPLSQDAEAPEALSLAQSHGLTGDATARPLVEVTVLCAARVLH